MPKLAPSLLYLFDFQYDIDFNIIYVGVRSWGGAKGRIFRCDFDLFKVKLYEVLIGIFFGCDK
ncbi:MAG: hypothetical protein NZ601_04845 [candidate division WOR-3 bacterium]|nr:hypothetical protein [candidate division WOR-3 bacterium]MCX7757317.1 hypothetical protein [candidate division WOR-3 bacterium]MDW7987151.1 hypothetical protein [candidate division WOR-3 bacterium]